jgi:hypothetical protein
VGRPKGSKNKVRTISQKTKVERAVEIFQSNNEIIRLNRVIDGLRSEIANLQHQAIGYKAVVSYLENQLGLKGSQ